MNTIIVSNNHLKAALNVLSKVVAANSILRNYECVKIEVIDGTMHLYATDAETSIRTDIPCEAKENFSFCIEHDVLKSLSDTVGECPLTISYWVTEENAHRVSITSDFGESEYSAQNVIDFPKMPDTKAKKTINIPSAGMGMMQSATAFVSTNNTADYNCCGVCFHLKESTLTIAATNKCYLYISDAIEAQTGITKMLLIPTKAAKIVCSYFQDGAAVDFLGDKNISFIRFSSESMDIYVRLIDQNFPNYELILPTHSESFSVDKSDLVNVARYASLSTDKTTNRIFFDLKGSTLSANAKDVDYAKSGKSKAIDVTGNQSDDFTFSFNAPQLLVSLAPFTDKVTFNHGGANRSFMFTSDGTKERVILQPLMII